MNTRELFFRNLGQTSEFPLALEIERAEGCYLYGPDGKRWLDLISGIAVSNLGHGHPAIVKAVCEQAEKHLHTLVYGELIQAPQVVLASRLVELFPSGIDRVFFVNSGSEAVEGALKLAKRYTGRTELVGFRHSYHGSTQGALSLGGDESFKNAFRPLLPDVRTLDFGVEEQLALITERSAAVLAEVVQAEAGVRIVPADYLQALRRRCTEVGALLIFDESQTGCGRTGNFLASTTCGVTPDVLVLAKALGGGLPLGAFAAPAEIMGSLTRDPALGHISTFGGHPLCCAAGLAALETLQVEGLMNRVPELEQRFRNNLVHPAIQAFRSAGLLMALEFDSEALTQQIIALALEKGLLSDWFLYAPQALRIAPPLTIQLEEIDWACAVLLECISEVSGLST